MADNADRTERDLSMPHANEDQVLHAQSPLPREVSDTTRRSSLEALRCSGRIELDEDNHAIQLPSMNSTQAINLGAVDGAGDSTRSRIATMFNDNSILGETSRITRTMFDHRRDVDELIEANANQRGHIHKKVETSIDSTTDLTPLNESYDLMNSFAEGGQANISSAIDRTLNRLVAIKSLKPDLVNNMEVRKNFIAEAKVTAQLDHPSIVPIYSLNKDRSNGLHLAMKLINGQTFKDYLDQVCTHYKLDGIAAFDEKKSQSFRIEIFLRVCEAMEYAHSRNVMHCDLKPENIMIGEYHETYVMDWGIARLIREPGYDPDKWTRPKQISGTPRFLSPEAINGEHCDQRADIFTLGLILFEAVTLKPAFVGQSSVEVMSNIKENKMEDLTHRFHFRIDRDIQAIIRKATEPDRDKRYQTVGELADDLRKYLIGAEVTANPDNCASRIYRWTSIHKRGTLLVTFILLFLAACTIAFSLYDKMNQVIVNRKRDNALSAAYARCSNAASQVDYQLSRLEFALRSLSREADFLLNHNVFEPKDGKPPHFYFIKDFRSEKTSPPSLVFSYAYKRKVDFDNFSVQTAPYMDMDKLTQELVALWPLREQMTSMLLESGGEILTGKNYMRLKSQACNEGMPVHWVYLTLASGAQLCFPGNDEYSENYDSRESNWYKNAAELRDSVCWSEPYRDSGEVGEMVITASTGIVDDKDKLLGVAALDLTFKNIRKIMESVGADKSSVIEKYLLNDKGKIIVRTRENEMPKYLPASQDSSPDSPNLPEFYDQSLFYEMRFRKYGVIIRKENMEQVVYAFARINSLNWFLVEKLHFQVLLNQSEHDFRKNGEIQSAE